MRNSVTNSRTEDLFRFYLGLERLETGVGGMRKLSNCNGRMKWPKRGVYFFFEPGESRSASDKSPRVVRIGTHALTANSRTSLWNRLSQHRGVAATGGGNHRGSIFRLIVGEALIARDFHCSVATWGKGASAPSDIRANEIELERKVSDIIREMPFLWLEVDDPPGRDSLRGYIESNSIALLSNYNRTVIDPPSSEWLGMHSPRMKVLKSGLWNQNHVEETHDPSFLSTLDDLIAKQVDSLIHP